MTDDLLPDHEHTEPDDYAAPDETYGLLSENEFDDVLSALETYPDEEALDGEENAFPEDANEAPAGDSRTVHEEELSAIDEDDRLRLPRAQLFRHRLRNQITMLPLALYLLALGAHLIARRQDVSDLPDLSSRLLTIVSVLMFASTLVFRALLGGRQERGLLLLGVWIWVVAGMVFVLVYGIDQQADAAQWWPLLLWALGLAYILIYPVERTHDIRLLWLAIMTLTAGGVAYAVTSDRIDEESLRDTVDYWPLLLSVVGVGLLPLAFRRRLGQDQ